MIDLKKINKILISVENKVLIKLFVFSISAMLLEILSLAVLVPVLNIILNPSKLQEYLIILNLDFKISENTYADFIIYSLLTIFVIFFLKGLLLIKINFSQNKIIYRVKAKLSSILLKKYLSEKYSFHLKNNSTKLIHNTLSEVNRFTGEHLIPATTFVTEILISLGLLFILLTVEPKGAFFTIILLILLLTLVTKFTKNIALDYGTKRQTNERISLKNLSQALTGIREVKILNKENKFIELFDTSNFAASDSIRNYNNFIVIPRIVIELIGVTSILFLIFFLMLSGREFEKIFTIISIFGIASFRFLPSFNRILIALQSLKYSIPSLNVVHEEISKTLNNTKETTDSRRIKFEKNLVFEDISFKYDNTENYILEHVNLDIKKNSIIGIYGESGAGKSTFVDVVAGLLKPTQGTFSIDGEKIDNRFFLNSNFIGYVSQNTFLIDDSIKKNIAFGVNENDINYKKIDEVLKISKLNDFIENLSDGLETIIGERGVKISGGQRQRICIARALYFDAPILIFDEATNALDSKTELEILETIFSVKEKTMIIIAHHFTEWRNCDKIYKLENKTLIEKNDFKSS